MSAKSTGMKRAVGVKPDEARIRDGSIRRMCRKAGITRIQDKMFDADNAFIKRHATSLVTIASVYSEVSGRKTITTSDMLRAAAECGVPVHGIE